MRKDNRDNLSLRKIEIIPNFIKNSEGSCLVRFGETQVVCTASVDTKVPRWLVGSGKGGSRQNMECYQDQPMKE